MANQNQMDKEKLINALQEDTKHLPSRILKGVALIALWFVMSMVACAAAVFLCQWFDVTEEIQLFMMIGATSLCAALILAWSSSHRRQNMILVAAGGALVMAGALWLGTMAGFFIAVSVVGGAVVNDLARIPDKALLYSISNAGLVAMTIDLRYKHGIAVAPAMAAYIVVAIPFIFITPNTGRIRNLLTVAANTLLLALAFSFH